MALFAEKAPSDNAESAEHTTCAAGGEYACGANDIIVQSVRDEKKPRRKVEALMRGEVISAERLKGFGTSTHKKYRIALTHEGKTYRALFKVVPPYYVNNEITATAISQSLKMNVTPLGVLRTIELPDGEVITGYLMEWIPGRDLSVMFMGDPIKRLDTDKHRAQHNLIALLNYFGSISDRGAAGDNTLTGGGKNWLLGNDGKLYSIDHEAVGYHCSSNEYQLKGLFPGGDIPVQAARSLIQAASSVVSSSAFLQGTYLEQSEIDCIRNKIKLVAAHTHISGDGKRAHIDVEGIIANSATRT